MCAGDAANHSDQKCFEFNNRKTQTFYYAKNNVSKTSFLESFMAS